MSSRGGGGNYYYPDYPEEEDIDIRVTRQRSRSPAPHLYHEPVYRHTRPPMYETHSSGREYIRDSGGYLIPAHSDGLRRSHSVGRRPSPPTLIAQPQQPVIINNRIYNDRDEEEEHYLQIAPIHRPHSRSHSRAGSFVSRDSREDWELEKARKELAAYKLENEKKEEAKRIKKELELEQLRKEKEEEEEEERLKKAQKEAVEKYKQEAAEKAAKEKKEKEEREKEYQQRLQDDLRNSGMDERQIAVVLKNDKQKALDPARPTYTRMSRRHLSIETLNRYRIDYEFDQDPDYILIKRWVPEYEQDFLWAHTREIREKRTVLLTIEAKKKKKEEVEFEFVRKKKHERKPSPSPLLTFLAGGKR